MTPAEIAEVHSKAIREFEWHDMTPLNQARMQEQAWEAVIKACREDSQAELERLRDENRALKAMLVDRIAADAKS